MEIYLFNKKIWGLKMFQKTNFWKIWHFSWKQAVQKSYWEFLLLKIAQGLWGPILFSFAKHVLLFNNYCFITFLWPIGRMTTLEIHAQQVQIHKNSFQSLCKQKRQWVPQTPRVVWSTASSFFRQSSVFLNNFQYSKA